MAEVKDYSAEALMAKEHEVELDTDDVKEENVSVEESKKEDSPNLNVGEVDLGYTDHSKKMKKLKSKLSKNKKLKQKLKLLVLKKNKKLI